MKHLLKIIGTTQTLWSHYAAVGFFSVLLGLMNLAIPFITGLAIDEIKQGKSADVNLLLLLAVAVFALDFGSTIVSNIGGYIGDVMAARLQKLLGERYYQQVLDLPQTYFDKELTGKIIARLHRSAEELSSFMNMLSNNFLQFIFTTVFSLIVIAIYSWQVALMLMLLYPIYIWLTSRSSGPWLNYQAKVNKHKDIALGRFSEAISQIKVVKSFNQENRELAIYKTNLSSIIGITKPQSAHWHKNDVYRRSILNLIFLGVYAFIFVRAGQGQFTAGQAVALVLYAMQIRIPIFTISFLVDRTQRAVADSKDYFEILDESPERSDNQNAKPLQIKNGSVEFSSVSFGYADDKHDVKDIDFNILPGQKVALVGESGEGKTTITNLLLGLYVPKQGIIYIDKQNIADITYESLRQNIGVVFQDPALFSGTIMENIAYANPKASKAEVIAAAKAANADDFISKFDKDYETEIGERGLKLSGGQKQRIAIARAILKDAPILVLDEATSSLDSKSEAAVQKALKRLMKDRTTLIIAHRLSTIAHVDKIITLKKGRIDEVGRPEELAKTSGIYAELLQLQSAPHKNAAQLKRLEIEQ